jgi:hypothetical protein
MKVFFACAPYLWLFFMSAAVSAEQRCLSNRECPVGRVCKEGVCVPSDDAKNADEKRDSGDRTSEGRGDDAGPDGDSDIETDRGKDADSESRREGEGPSSSDGEESRYEAPTPDACTDGKVPLPGGCCWPGQSWDDKEFACVGTPTCPEGMIAHKTLCYTACGDGRFRPPGQEECCLLGQQYDARKGCSGVGACPPDIEIDHEKNKCMIPGCTCDDDDYCLIYERCRFGTCRPVRRGIGFYGGADAGYGLLIYNPHPWPWHEEGDAADLNEPNIYRHTGALHAVLGLTFSGSSNKRSNYGFGYDFLGFFDHSVTTVHTGNFLAQWHIFSVEAGVGALVERISKVLHSRNWEEESAESLGSDAWSLSEEKGTVVVIHARLGLGIPVARHFRLELGTPFVLSPSSDRAFKVAWSLQIGTRFLFPPEFHPLR